MHASGSMLELHLDFQCRFPFYSRRFRTCICTEFGGSEVECEISFERGRPYLPVVRLIWCSGGFPEWTRATERISGRRVSGRLSSGRKCHFDRTKMAILAIRLPFLFRHLAHLFAAIWHCLQCLAPRLSI